MNKGLAYLLLVITFFTNSSMEQPKKKKYNRWATRKLKQIAANKNPSNGEIREFVTRGANPNIIARPYKEQWSLLRLAIMRADVDFDLVLLLFNRGVNLNDSSGPMQMAVQMRDFDIVERLTAKGADVNLVDYQNQT